MIGGLKAVSCAGVVMRAVLLVAPPAEAAVYYDSIYWVGGDNSGQLAGACIYTIPDNMPLSQPVTLVVDANTPVEKNTIQSNKYFFIIKPKLFSIKTNNIGTTS